MTQSTVTLKREEHRHQQVLSIYSARRIPVENPLLSRLITKMSSEPVKTLSRDQIQRAKPNLPELNAIVRDLKATYSSSKKMWWLPWNRATVNTVYTAFKGKAWVDYTALRAEDKAAPAQLPVSNTPPVLGNRMLWHAGGQIQRGDAPLLGV